MSYNIFENFYGIPLFQKITEANNLVINKKVKLIFIFLQKNENLGFDESIDASIREAEEHNRFKRMHLRNPTQENQVGFKINIFTCGL